MLAIALTALFALTMTMALIVLARSARVAFSAYGQIRDALAATPDLRHVRVGHADIVVNVVAPARHAVVTRFPATVRHPAHKVWPLAA